MFAQLKPTVKRALQTSGKVLASPFSFRGLSTIIGLCFFLSLAFSAFLAGDFPPELARALLYAEIFLGLAGMAALAVWLRTIERRLRQLLTVASQTIAPLVQTGDAKKLGIFEEMDELSTALEGIQGQMNYLINQMADKVVIEQEVQYAELFQAWFFPQTAFHAQDFSLHGRYLSATQCGGDWWQYLHRGDELLVLVGDVTGHGVASAMVTAAVQAAYSVLVAQMRAEEGNGKPISLNAIFAGLNQAVIAVGGTEATMTLYGSVMNLKTGRVTALNASHRPSYIFRTKDGGGYKIGRVLTGTLIGPLGKDCDPTPAPQEFQLAGGDFMLWFTDGLLECLNPKGEQMSKIALFNQLQAKMVDCSGAPEQMTEAAIEEVFQFIGGRARERADDVIVIFGAVPQETVFQAETGAEAVSAVTDPTQALAS